MIRHIDQSPMPKLAARLAPWLLFSAGLGAQGLPAPPASPAPVTRLEYDAVGRPTASVAAPGVTGFGFATTQAYDKLGRLVTSTDARNGVTSLVYDGQDQLLQVTDPRRLATSYLVNGLGDRTRLQSPDTGVTASTFDAARRLATRTDARGAVSTHAYDALGRLVGITTVLGQTSAAVGWAYDETGPGFSNGIGRLTSLRYPAGTTRFAHDPKGRVIQVTQALVADSSAQVPASSLSVGYAYDAADQITRIVYPSGRALFIAWAGGRPVSMALAANASAVAVPLLSQIVHEPFGPPSSWLWGLAAGPAAHAIVRDAYGRVVRHPLGPTLTRDITYDAADRIVRYTHWLTATGAPAASFDQAFAYDELGRVTVVALPSQAANFGYDANGNRTVVVWGSTVANQGIAAGSNRLLTTTQPTRSLAYSAAGAMTSSQGSFVATYGPTGEMLTYSRNAQFTRYAYDAEGRRVRKSGPASGTRFFVYDLQDHLLGEYDAAGNPVAEFVWLGDTPVAMFTPDSGGAAAAPKVFHIHSDHLGSPLLMVDRTNAIRWAWLSEPFGGTAAQTDPSGLGAVTLNLRFPGQYYDVESGWHYNRFRYYDPALGRYTQSDPIGLAGGINTYAYVGGNPLSFTDPDGLQSVPLRPPGRTPPLPYRVEQHNYETDPWRQLQRQFTDDPSAPIVGMPNNEPWCREVCDAPGTCSKQPEGSIPTGNGCYRVCTPGPFADAAGDPYQPRYSMNRRPGRGDMFGLYRILRGK